MTTILLTLLLSMAGATASAHDIEAVNTDGVTIYYSWTNGNTELAVSYRGTSVGSYFDEYSGNVVIPATVNYEGTDYPVTSIDGAFWYCTELTSVSIPNSVKSIERLAFSYCSKLSSITIPNSVTSIGNEAFSNCYALTSIIVEEGNTVFDSRDNCNAIIRTATNTLIAGCQNTTILNSVTSLGDYAFAGCRNLTSVTIPNSVTTIGINAFSGCTNLTSVTIPKSVTIFGTGVFQSCVALTSIIVEEGNTVYDSRDNCNAVIRTATNALMAGCQNTTIPNTVTLIGDYAFYECTNLTNIDIPNSVTSIGMSAFQYCTGLTRIDIPNSVTIISPYAFYECSNVTTLTIGSSMTEIGPYSFAYFRSLTDVYCYAKRVPTTNSNAFNNTPYNSYNSSATLHVPAASIELYRAAEPWKNFFKIEALPVEKLVAALVPSNGNRLRLLDSNGEIVCDAMISAMVSIDKGENYVVRAYNNDSRKATNLFVNAVDCTTALDAKTVDDCEVEDLTLENVQENLLIEARYTPKSNNVNTLSTEGGITTMYYVNLSDGDTYYANIINTDNSYPFIKYGTDVRFVFTPDEGYELGFVFSLWNRSIGDGEGDEVVPRGDGSYEFTFPASSFLEGNADIVVYYKKKGGGVDVNGDGEFNIADVTKLVNMLLKRE